MKLFVDVQASSLFPPQFSSGSADAKSNDAVQQRLIGQCRERRQAMAEERASNKYSKYRADGDTDEPPIVVQMAQQVGRVCGDDVHSVLT